MRLLAVVAAIMDFAVVLTVKTTQPPVGYNVKAMNCKISEEGLRDWYYPNTTCYSKSYNRYLTTVNAFVYLRQPFYKCWISAELQYKYGTIYRPAVSQKKFEACAILADIRNNKNPLFRLIYIGSLIYAPNLVHPCPFDYLELNNFSIDARLIPKAAWIPRGDYRFFMSFYPVDKKPAMLNATFYLSVRSNVLIESFG